MWIIDPSTGKPSVSLTLLVVTATVCVIAEALEMSNIIHSTSMSYEMFATTCGLYFGRKFSSSKGAVLDKEDK
jgi:thiamine biosynthesis lipoprotein ApbE